MTKQRWRDLTVLQKRAIALSGLVQAVLLAAALIDIYRHPEEIRGNKFAWTAVSLINFVGPISYFLFGRRR